MSGFILDCDASNEQNAVRRKGYFVLVTMNTETIRTSRVNLNGKMGNVNGRKFTEKNEKEE